MSIGIVVGAVVILTWVWIHNKLFGDIKFKHGLRSYIVYGSNYFVEFIEFVSLVGSTEALTHSEWEFLYHFPKF